MNEFLPPIFTRNFGLLAQFRNSFENAWKCRLINLLNIHLGTHEDTLGPQPLPVTVTRIKLHLPANDHMAIAGRGPGWFDPRESTEDFWKFTRRLLFFAGKLFIWVVVSNIFHFHPYLGKISHLTNIFQMG